MVVTSTETHPVRRARKRIRKRPSEVKRILLSKRVHEGFHRLGTVMGILLTLVIFLTAFSVNDAIYLQVVLAGVTLGLALYGLIRAFGWIVVGFLE